MTIAAELVAWLERIARDAAPREACGLVIAIGGYACGFLESPNDLTGEDAETGYLLPGAVVGLAELLESINLEVIVWHSHPAAGCFPSRSDLAYARAGSRCLVSSLLAGGQTRAFAYERTDDDRHRGRLRAREEPLELLAGPAPVPPAI